MLIEGESDDFVLDEDLVINNDGTYFFDQEAKYFEFVLHYYRNEKFPETTRLTPLFREIWLHIWRMPEEALDELADSDESLSGSIDSEEEEVEEEEEDRELRDSEISGDEIESSSSEDVQKESEESVDGENASVGVWVAGDPNAPDFRTSCMPLCPSNPLLTPLQYSEGLLSGRYTVCRDGPS
jgi:hypothetical protein